MKAEDDDSTDAIARRLEFLRRERSLQQNEFAALAGIRPTQYNNWVTGRARLSLEGAKKIVKAYDVSLDFLIFGKTGQLSEQMCKAWVASLNKPE